MKNMKRVLYAAAATAFAAVPLMARAQTAASPSPAQNGFSVSATGTAASTLKNTTVFALLTTFMNWLLGIVGVLAVVAFVVSGIFYLTAAGNEERIKTAKDIMLYAIIGIVVALLGLIIVNAVAGLTGGSGGVTSF